MSEWKPCPFCGKPLHVFYNYRLKAWTWYCDTENCAGRELGYDSEEKAIAAINRRAQPANDPLTLEQLREMDGEPVYCVYPGCSAGGEWLLVNSQGAYKNGSFLNFRYYGEWKAYRRKPERSAADGKK